MATIFISCAYTDNAMAKAIETRLLDRGHGSKLPIGTAIAGAWRMKITRALSGSDTLIAILTEAGLRSPNVLGEVGAARVLEYTKRMLLLPVLVGDIAIPDFVSDVFCFRLAAASDPNFDSLVQELHRAITDNVKLLPRIFVSHRHKDEPIAAALVALLEQAFYVERTDIRCTSVQPYMLTPGERTSEKLRTEISSAELVIGILSPDTADSNYVLCELGASWGHDVPTFPVLARGAKPADIPSPLNERHSISLESEENCIDLVQDVASKISLRRREGAMGRVAHSARLLAETARARTTQASSAS